MLTGKRPLDPKKMVDQLHDLGFKVTLWVTPFAEETSKAYHEGRAKGYWVKDSTDPSKPVPSKWWNVRILAKFSILLILLERRERAIF